MREELLRLQRVTMREKDVAVLANLDLHLFAGEILGLLFVDYQGRDALVELICQNRPLHHGAVWFKEQKVNSYQKSALAPNGVTVIDGKERLVGDMTVADNIFVLRRGFKKYLLRPSVLNRQMAFFANQAGIEIDGGALVRRLSPYEKCVVQLLKAVITGHRVIIVQDISSLISAADLNKFHSLMRHFSAQGFAFLYLANHHEEVFGVCHRSLLFDGGRVVRDIPSSQFPRVDFSMYGYPVGHFGPPPAPAARSVLRLEEVCTAHLRGLSFSLSPGECAVLLDTGGAALQEVFSLFRPGGAPAAGRVLFWGRPLAARRPAAPKDIGLIAEKPTESMLYPDFSGLDNLCFAAGEKMPKVWRSPRLRKNLLREYLPLVGPGLLAEDIRALPAADLYNLVYYSQYLRRPHLLVILQPFFGADLYLRSQILFLIDQIRKRGTAVLILSMNISDSPVLADRMLVLENGRITREFTGEDMQMLNERKAL